MKKILAWILALTMTIALVGCNQPSEPKVTPTPEPTPTPDELFLEAYSSGLEKRWEITFNIEYQNDEEYIALMKDGVIAELSTIEDYKGVSFVDNKLGVVKDSIIEAVEKQQEALKYASADPNLYSEMWDEAYNERTKLIQTLVDDYGFTVSDGYKETLEEMLINANLVIKREDTNAAIDNMVQGINFELEENSYGWNTFTAIVENTTGEDFDNFSLTIKLYDADGVVVESNYSNTINNWNSGEKAKFEFMSDKEFVTIALEANWF